MIFDVLTKKRCIRETEEVAYLLDTIVGLLQKISDILDHMLRYPLTSGFARVFFA